MYLDPFSPRQLKKKTNKKPVKVAPLQGLSDASAQAGLRFRCFHATKSAFLMRRLISYEPIVELLLELSLNTSQHDEAYNFMRVEVKFLKITQFHFSSNNSMGLYFDWIYLEMSISTVVPTKSDYDVILCLQLLSKPLTCTLHLS